MRQALCLTLALGLISGIPHPARADAPPAKIMIVGVSHLVARRDAHNSVFADSPLDAKRQQQVAEVVDHLARFHPTKVLVEQDLGDPKTNQRYRQYVAGAYKLTANEVDQFGFRLAAKSGNTEIYGIDADGPPIIDEKTASGKRIVAYLEKNMASVSTPAFASYLARNEELERNGTYLELLRFLNTDEAIRANASVYAVLDGMGRSEDNAGATFVAMWYGRNANIFSNILSIVQPGDRVVVLMGQGHEYLLRDFARLNPNLEVVDPLTYL